MIIKVSKIMVVLIAVLWIASIASASDSTDTLGATITGTPVHTLIISGAASLIINDPGNVGSGELIPFTGGPLTLHMTDNDYTVSGGETVLKAKISTALPDQYGSDKAYVIVLGVPAASGYGPDDDTFGRMHKGASLTDSDETSSAHLIEILPNQSIAHAIFNETVTQDVYLKVNNGKVLRSDTSDDITITFTFPSY